MNEFKNFKIQPKTATFTGDKIKIERILNTKIIVHDYKIEKSKQKENTQLLTLQIEKTCGTKHIIFTGSTILIQMIQEVKKEDLPFQSTIVKNNEYFEFT